MVKFLLHLTKYFVARPKRPKASEVLTNHLAASKAHWTSFSVPYRSVENDQFGRSHFNWVVGSANYHVLRTGCWPFIKYHCTQRPYQDLTAEDRLFGVLKLINFGIPTLAYGVACWVLVRHHEDIQTPKGTVRIYFLYEEDRGSKY